MYRRGSSNREKIVRVRERLEVSELFKAYYSLRPEVEAPSDVTYREFAFQLFKDDVYVRHISFDSAEDLEKYLALESPKNAYYSVARYELPSAPNMDEKGWLGSELMFDIDVDHIEGCRDGLGDNCLLKGYSYARRLAEMLYRDFSIAPYIYFTGNRGFHVIGDCDWCRDLDRRERRELTTYFTLEGLDLDLIIPLRLKRGKPVKPSPSDPGLRGWIGRELEARGLDVIDKSVLEEIVEYVRIPIDVQVTQDISRLARIRGTLNGKAGLRVVRVGMNGFSLGSWLSPFKGEVVFRSTRGLDHMRVLGETVELVEGREYSLPAHIAVYLQLKGYGVVVKGEIVVRADSSRGTI
ncbi:MAG: DNA primase small subunit PriS [Aeropyrum sp.]|nr:DNA primase small subunit PriS [Aeropyrum sp.]